MGGDKLKNYNLESVLPENRAIIIRQLWNDFDDLYTTLQDPMTDPIMMIMELKHLHAVLLKKNHIQISKYFRKIIFYIIIIIKYQQLIKVLKK